MDQSLHLACKWEIQAAATSSLQGQALLPLHVPNNHPQSHPRPFPSNFSSGTKQISATPSTHSLSRAQALAPEQDLQPLSSTCGVTEPATAFAPCQVSPAGAAAVSAGSGLCDTAMPCSEQGWA